MSPIRWRSRPDLDRPVLVAAFEGWNDAGDSASGAARWLLERQGATQIGIIDCEEYFDFTTTRPVLAEDDEGSRTIEWPDIEIWAAPMSDGRDLVVLIGQEPQLRWRSFTTSVLQLVADLEVSLVLTLGALLSDIPHTRPTVVTGTTDDPDMAERLHLVRSTYEGPTGIVGVLGSALRDARVPTASLWASVPTYVSGAPSPKATLALIERTCDLLGFHPPTTDLEIASAAYVRQLNELVAADEDTAAYVAGLEEAADDEGEPLDDIALTEADAGELVQEVERFLRGD